jgi:PAS domain-containing protein
MSHNSTPLKLAIYLAIVIVLTGMLDFVYSEALPFLYDEIPILADLNGHRPYLIDMVINLLILPFAIFAFSRTPAVQRVVMRAFGSVSSLNEIVFSAKFAADTGIMVVDSECRVLSATSVWAEDVGLPEQDALVGKKIDAAFNPRFARLLNDILDKSRSTRKVSFTDIAEWSQFGILGHGPAVVYATPSFKGDNYVGSMIAMRSTAEVRSAEDSAILFQMNYQTLFDNLPLGGAVFRPSTAADGGADGYILDANPAFKRAMEGIQLPYTDPCSVVWPSFLHQAKLREGISAMMSGASRFRCEFFAPALGKNLAVTLAGLPGGRVLAMVADLTESRNNEQKVLTLNDQLQRTLTTQREYVRCVLEDIQHFNQALSDLVETHLEDIRRLIPDLPGHEAQILSDASTTLHLTLNQMLRYHNVSNLPFTDTELVHPSELVTRLLEPLTHRYPDVAIRIGSLPAVVANREILTDILEQLLVAVARLPIIEPPGRIELGSQEDFLEVGISISAWGFDVSTLFVELPTEKLPLDWTLTSDLDIAAVRRMVTKHGGTLWLGPTADGAGIEVSFSIGTPPA